MNPFLLCSEPFKAFALVAPMVRAFEDDCFIELSHVIVHRDCEMRAYIFFFVCLFEELRGGGGAIDEIPGIISFLCVRV